MHLFKTGSFKDEYIQFAEQSEKWINGKLFPLIANYRKKILSNIDKMKILTADIGTGTQDIYLYDSRLDMENGIKLILPSATLLVSRKLQKATNERRAVVLTGTTMGGGPNFWAAKKHLESGLDLFATVKAAKSFNDDLDVVQSSGIRIVSEEEAKALAKKICSVEMKDFDFILISEIFHKNGVTLRDLGAVAVAVFDHGEAPAGISDRKFRFDYMDERIRKWNRLSTFAYRSEKIPLSLTRMRSVAETLREVQSPVIVMDTAPAAVLGALFDEHCKSINEKVIVNIGNSHTIAFKLNSLGIDGVFEHHTGFMDKGKLEGLLERLANGTLNTCDVFDDQGHGALMYDSEPLTLNSGNVIVTGPRRRLLKGSRLSPHYAVPFGDMMISGCFGLLSAVADTLPEYAEQIHESMEERQINNQAPWEVEE